MSEPKWSETDIPDQTGRTALVTGANSGIGYEAARALAQRGAKVLLGCRNPEKAATALERIRVSAPGADVQVLPLDLADLSSVRAAATTVNDSEPKLDLLINNAGVMALPLSRTADGFEMQFGTNHLGHFALTGLLLDRLNAAPAARVVSVSSQGHRMGRIAFDDLDATEGYHRWLRYGQSKVANLLFTYELQRRLLAADSTTIALACHPGGSNTELGRDAGFLMKTFQPIANLVMHSATMGALPTLRAATDPMAKGSDYYGPDGISQTRGFPIKVHSSAYSHKADVARQLWTVSEEMTGVSWLD
ncbi:MAG: dehydrogenase/reductase [Ilumatobacteraceae bacterium]|nr:dehydrogenase/reductase [Ilumatobacteraceae bacterium]